MRGYGREVGEGISPGPGGPGGPGAAGAGAAGAGGLVETAARRALSSSMSRSRATIWEERRRKRRKRRGGSDKTGPLLISELSLHPPRLATILNAASCSIYQKRGNIERRATALADALWWFDSMGPTFFFIWSTWSSSNESSRSSLRIRRSVPPVPRIPLLVTLILYISRGPLERIMLFAGERKDPA